MSMVEPDSIRDSIRDGLSCEQVRVTGDGHHFEAWVISADFEGKSRVQRHQMVYATLGDRMREEIHALSIHALTPQQWAEAQA